MRKFLIRFDVARGMMLAILILTALSSEAVPAQQMQWKALTGILDYQLTPIYGTQGIPSASHCVGLRDSAVSWTGADGKLYLFGGGCEVENNDLFNDLWRYDPVTGNWTWLNGSSAIDQTGVYGTRDVAASANIPGARYGSVSWTGTDGKLYLFGGYGYDCSGYQTNLGDLWCCESGGSAAKTWPLYQ